MGQLSLSTVIQVVVPLVGMIAGFGYTQATLGNLQGDVDKLENLPVAVAVLQESVSKLESNEVVSRVEVSRMIELATLRITRNRNP